MILSNNYLESLLNSLEEEEFNYTIPYLDSQENPLFILKRGQLIFLEDLNKLIIGDGISRQDNCLGLVLGFPSFSSNNTKEEIVHKTWAYLSSTARLFELEKIVFPSELQTTFIKNKPDNFSFLLGEPVPDKSPLGQFTRNFPNVAGHFFRNYDHSKNIDSLGNRDMFLKQSFDLEDHQHEFWTIYNSGDGGANYALNIARETTTGFTWHNMGSHGISEPKGDNLKIEEEVRPKNFATLICMRTY